MSKDKAGEREAGKAFATGVLIQDDDELDVKLERLVASKDTPRELIEQACAEVMRDPRLRNPVFRRLRSQARAGVGSEPDQLPSSTFASLCDRAWGKVKETLGIEVEDTTYRDLTDEQLRARAVELAQKLREV